MTSEQAEIDNLARTVERLTKALEALTQKRDAARELIEYVQGALDCGHFTYQPDEPEVGLVEDWPNRARKWLAEN